MKKIVVRILIFASLFNIAGMCSDDNDSSYPSMDATVVINTMKAGTWRITFFEDSGTNETSNFTGYNFTFADSAVLTASNGANTYTGTWSVTNDSSGDDSPTEDLDFNMAFSAPSNFAELTEDWNILERTDTKIRLVHVSGGDGGTDYVTFEKN